MGFLIQIVATYAPWIYALCGIFALIQMYRIWQVRAERRQALFTLEREKAMRDLYNIFFISMVILAAMGVTYFTSQTLPAAVDVETAVSVASETPSPDILPTPSPTPEPPTATPTITPVIPTATLAPVEIVEQVLPPTPTAEPVAGSPHCLDPRVTFSSPGDGALVSGVINITGRAVHEQFHYYKIEYAPGADAESGFVYLVGGNSMVDNGSLGVLDSNALSNGTWTLRLVVVDKTGNFPDPCRVTITVQN